MKKIYFFLPFWMMILVAFSALSQKKGDSHKEKFKFGNVTVQELEEIPQGDSSASAVVLFDVGKTFFERVPDRIQLVYERHVRIKINSKAGYEFANGVVGLYHNGNNSESISKFEAATYNLEFGKLVVNKLTKEGIFDDKVVDDYKFKKFAMPNVKEGSIIEYKYRIYSQFVFNIRPWSFQKYIPVLYSKYVVDLPEFIHFKKEMKGYEVIHTEVKEKMQNFFGDISSNVETYTFIGENIPAFREEAYLTCADNYMSSIIFEVSNINLPGEIPIKIISDWEQIGRDLDQHQKFGQILNKKGAVKTAVDSILLTSKTEKEKIEAVYDHIRKNLKWNENKGIYASQTVKKTLEDKSGNVADINLLLTLMLKAAGVTADPVILSTRENGIVLPFFAPMLTKFNYLICQVKIDGKNYLIDATDKWRPFDILPLRCLNGVGRVFYEKGSDWVTLKNNENSFNYHALDFSLTEDGLLEGKINSTTKNYAAFLARKKAGVLTQDEYLEQVKQTKESWEIKELTVENLEKLSDPFVEKYEVKINNMTNKAGDKIYLDPLFLGKIIENPFKMEERKYPVDYGYPITSIYHCTLKLPVGYALEEPIKPTIVTLPERSGRFTYEVSEAAGVLQIKTNFAISKTVFLPEEYAILKSFYNHIIAKHSEQIVLKKK